MTIPTKGGDAVHQPGVAGGDALVSFSSSEPSVIIRDQRPFSCLEHQTG